MSIGEVEIKGHMDRFDQCGQAVDSLVSGGCIISGSKVRRSVLFSNVRVQNYCEIDNCVILPNVEIGNNVTLRRVIADKRCPACPTG